VWRYTAFRRERFNPTRTPLSTTQRLISNTYDCVSVYIKSQTATILLCSIVSKNHKHHPVYPIEVTKNIGEFSHLLRLRYRQLLGISCSLARRFGQRHRWNQPHRVAGVPGGFRIESRKRFAFGLEMSATTADRTSAIPAIARSPRHVTARPSRSRRLCHRTTVTGTGDRRTTFSATLPSRRRETPSRPWLPTTTWLMSSRSA